MYKMEQHKVSKTTSQEFPTQHYSKYGVLQLGISLWKSVWFGSFFEHKVSKGSLLTLHEILGLFKSMYNSKKEEFDYKY